MAGSAATRRRTPLRPDVPVRQFLSVADAARYLGIDERSVRRHINEGRLRAYRIGHLIKVDLRDLDEFARPVKPGEVSP